MLNAFQSEMPPGFLCDYYKGMFSYEDMGKPNWLDELYLLSSVCHHEAGHAVVGYASGYKIKSASVVANRRRVGGEDVISFSGYVRHDRDKYCRPSVMARLPYRRAHFREGLYTAAGPAAERLYRLDKTCLNA